MHKILEQDDCAPDSLEYFQEKFKEIVGMDLKTFKEESISVTTNYTFFYKLNEFELRFNEEGYRLFLDIFSDEFLKEIGFTRDVERKRSMYRPNQIYGKAKDKIGMTILEWNEEGASCTYFGDKLPPNMFLRIGKDAGTRTAFNGYVFTRDDVRKLLKLTW